MIFNSFLVSLRWTNGSLLFFIVISNDFVKPFKALSVSSILVLGVGTRFSTTIFLVLGAGIGLSTTIFLVLGSGTGFSTGL